MNRAQAHNWLTRWKIYETHKSELNSHELADYQHILKTLESLNDEQLNYIYMKYNAMAAVRERGELLNCKANPTVFIYRTALPKPAEVIAALGLDPKGYFSLQHAALDAIRNNYRSETRHQIKH